MTQRPMSRFEDLDIWKESMDLAVEVYEQFDESRDFTLRDQICRSAISVPSNIAEGYERRTNRDFIRFLRIEMGSLAELRTQLYLAQRVGKCPASAAESMIEQTKRIAAKTTKLIQYRESRDT